MLTIVIGVIVIVVVVFGAYAVFLAVASRSRRPVEPGLEWVYINDDGSAREITEVERQRLTADYPAGDSRRPYVKLRYQSRDDQGRRRGFLRHRQLPPDVPIAKA